MEKTWYNWVVYILVIVGAVNWGLVGLFNWNLVAALLGTGTFATVVYTLVGLSGLYLIYLVSKE